MKTWTHPGDSDIALRLSGENAALVRFEDSRAPVPVLSQVESLGRVAEEDQHWSPCSGSPIRILYRGREECARIRGSRKGCSVCALL